LTRRPKALTISGSTSATSFVNGLYGGSLGQEKTTLCRNLRFCLYLTAISTQIYNFRFGGVVKVLLPGGPVSSREDDQLVSLRNLSQGLAHISVASFPIQLSSSISTGLGHANP
jgi:hypothetical protein